MATSPNYGWEEPDDTDLVKDGALSIRTMGNAIDTSMYAALNGKPAGLVLLNTTTVSASATVTIDSVFSSTYDDYVIKIDLSVAANSAFNMVLRKSGATLTGSTYSCTYWYGYLKGTSSGQPYYSGTYFAFHQANVCRGVYGNFNINSPFLTAYTTGTHQAVQYDNGSAYPYIFQGGFYDENARSADGFQLNTPSSTMTGTVRVYGVKNS